MKSKNLLNKKATNGFTLIELLISMVLGLILIGGVYSVFTENARTSQFVQATSRTQENGRFALSELVTSARMIGYMGCFANLDADSDALFNALAPNPNYDYYYDLTAGQLDVIDYTGQALPVGLQGVITPTLNTDILVIRGLSSQDYNLATAMPTSSAVVKIKEDGNSGIVDGAILYLSDCSKGAVFQAINSTLTAGATVNSVVHNQKVGEPGNATKDLSIDGTGFSEDATVQKFETKIFFIAPAAVDPVTATAYVNSAGNPILALWQKNGGNAAFELVWGIQDLELWMGEDSSKDGVPDRIVRPAQLSVPGDSRNVVSLDIRIRANSIDPVGPDMIERDFFASVKFRNRGL